MAHPPLNPVAARQFARMLFGHKLLAEMKFGTSRFPPAKGGLHAWHGTSDAAADWALKEAVEGNVYLRMTPSVTPPQKGRGTGKIADAIVGVHGDIDIAGPAHTKDNLPPDAASAMKIIERVGLPPTCVVNSGHGLQPHWLLEEPFVFFGEANRERAADLASRFQHTLAAAAKVAGGWESDSVGDLARILRFPGTINHKLDLVPVELLMRDGPRFALGDIESVLVDPLATSQAVADDAPPGTLGFPGSDHELLAAARAAQNGARFAQVYDTGTLAHHGGDHSAADLYLAGALAFWCGPDRDRIDRLFRGSKLMRPKWDEIHDGNGRTYGRMTLDKALANRTTFYQQRSGLPSIMVSNRQLRHQSDDAQGALEALNTPPTVFQRGTDIVRVRVDESSGESVIERINVDAMVGMLTRSADFFAKRDTKRVAVRPPQAIAKDILSLPRWRFPPLVGIVSYPRVRADGTLLTVPGYDPATHLWLAEYEGASGFSVPLDPTDSEVADARALVFELLADFPFVNDASRANAVAYMLTPVIRHAFHGCVPIAAFDALSKQGTGKSLLARCGMIAACGREPSMSAIPGDEPEWRKSLTALLDSGREVVIFDNATKLTIESGVWANAVTADQFDDRLLGLNKRGSYRVRFTWAVTGNSMGFGGDLTRRVYQVMQDAGCEHPEDRSDFKHELPGWALANRLALNRALLVLCRRWWCLGCPVPRLAPWGSFDGWQQTAGGILESAGIPGFLANRVAFRDAADSDRAEWGGFVLALAAAFPGQKEFNAGDLAKAVAEPSPLQDALPDNLRDGLGQPRFAQRLGYALKARAGAVFGNLRLERVGQDRHSRKPVYRVQAHTGCGD